MRRNAAGEPLRIELMTTAGNRTRELIQQVAQGQWRELGIDTVIRNEPARVFFGETTSKRRFSGLALFAWISSPENVPRSTLHAQEIPTEANGWSGQNFPGYRNPRMDELLDEIEVELDRDKRQALWHELQRIYAEDLPALPLFFRADAHVWPTWLRGVEPTGHMAPVTLWVEQWRPDAS
jgi:peptide/nickel transport system substrate-binding protein